MSDFFPELRFLIDNANYFNSIITNNNLIITTRIRRLRGRPRHIYDQLLRIALNRAEYSHTFVRVANEFLRVFPDFKNGWLRNKLYQRGVYSEGDNESIHSIQLQYRRDPNTGRPIRPSRTEAMNNLATRMYIGERLERENVYDNDNDNSSVEVQRDRDNGRREPVRQPTLSNPFHYDERGVMIRTRAILEDISDRFYRQMRRGDITEERYYEIQRQLEERYPNFPIPMEHRIRNMSDTIVIDTTIPALERAPERPPVDAFVEHLIVRPNIKMTDWKQEKPDECPVCCGDCDEHPLSCGHYVCSNCIVNSKKATCPCCRQDVALDVPVYQRLYNAIYN